MLTFGLMLLMQAAAAPPPAVTDAASLNAAVIARNDAVALENARRDAVCQAERARYEAALAENGRARAAALAAQRAYEAEMAARLQPPVPAPARAAATSPALATLPSGGKVRNASDQGRVDQAVSQLRKTVCRTSVDTGSLVRKTRNCASAETWRRRGVAEREAAEDMMMNNMGRPPGQ